MLSNGDRVKAKGTIDTTKSTNLYKGVIEQGTEGIVVFVTIYPKVAGIRFNGIPDIVTVGTEFVDKIDRKLGEPETYLDVLQHRQEMLQSFKDSIEAVGGDSYKFLKNLDKMTVQEMVDVLAQNGVRFTTNR